MKKNVYSSPEITVISCYAPDILNSSTTVPYNSLASGNGEWLEWGQIKG